MKNIQQLAIGDGPSSMRNIGWNNGHNTRFQNLGFTIYS